MVSAWLLPPPLHLLFWAAFSCTAGDELSCPRGLRSSPCSSCDAFLTFFLSLLSFFPPLFMLFGGSGSPAGMLWGNYAT